MPTCDLKIHLPFSYNTFAAHKIESLKGNAGFLYSTFNSEYKRKKTYKKSNHLSNRNQISLHW